jgi:hypothetical protein
LAFIHSPPDLSLLSDDKTDKHLHASKINNLIRSVSVKEMETIINNTPKEKALGFILFSRIIPILYNLFQRIQAEGIFFLTHCMIPELPK